jgi:hypothetical protein
LARLTSSRRKSNVAHRKAQSVRHRHALRVQRPRQPLADLRELVEIAIADGTGANQANNVFSDERTLAASTPRTWTSPARLPTPSARRSRSRRQGDPDRRRCGQHERRRGRRSGFERFRRPFADATDKINIGPGDVFLITRRSAAGLPVVAATGDILKIANSGAGSAVTYRIIIIGEA